jgi:transposase
MLYVGIDVHKRSLQVCVLDESGNRTMDRKLDNDRESLTRFFDQFELPALKVALESTYNWGMIYDLLSGKGIDVHICHAREARLIGMSRVKTDRNDALRLALLLRGDLLPEAYVPSIDCRELRELVRSRASLRRTGTRIKNRIHAILASNWIKHGYSDLFGKGGRQFLRDLEISESRKIVITSDLDLLESVESQISVLDQEIKRRAHLDLRAMLLTTIPGVAEFTALLILSEIGEISRFHRPEGLVSYAGLHPSEDSSGETVRRGRITKEGSRWLRWILVEAAQHVIRQEGKIQDLYLRLLPSKGHNRAIVAAAREMLVSIYFMLTRMEPYRPDGRSRIAASTGQAG